jgi:hypothetical protein
MDSVGISDTKKVVVSNFKQIFLVGQKGIRHIDSLALILLPPAIRAH